MEYLWRISLFIRVFFLLLLFSVYEFFKLKQIEVLVLFNFRDSIIQSSDIRIWKYTYYLIYK